MNRSVEFFPAVAPGVALTSTQIHAGYREAWSSVKFAKWRCVVGVCGRFRTKKLSQIKTINIDKNSYIVIFYRHAEDHPCHPAASARHSQRD
jgi:hypothetical protein